GGPPVPQVLQRVLAVQKLPQLQQQRVTARPAGVEALRWVFVKALAALDTQPLGGHQLFDHRRWFRAAANLRHKIAERGELYIESGKVMDFERSKRRKAEADGATYGRIDFFGCCDALVNQVPHFTLNGNLHAVDKKAR